MEIPQRYRDGITETIPMLYIYVAFYSFQRAMHHFIFITTCKVSTIINAHHK